MNSFSFSFLFIEHGQFFFFLKLATLWRTHLTYHILLVSYERLKNSQYPTYFALHQISAVSIWHCCTGGHRQAAYSSSCRSSNGLPTYQVPCIKADSGNNPRVWSDVCFFFFFFLSHFYFPASGQVVVSGFVPSPPPERAFSFNRAYRVQHSHCSSTFIECC